MNEDSYDAYDDTKHFSRVITLKIILYLVMDIVLCYNITTSM